MKGIDIKGEYRDALSSNREIILDTGWKSNAIMRDYGRFLAALMKKDFNGMVGIDYMAVGSGSGNDPSVFKDKVVEFFKQLNKSDSGDNPGPYEKGEKNKNGYYWVWAKEIDADGIKYLDGDEKEVVDPDKITNHLKIDLKFEEEEPYKDALVFKEFALLGIDKKNGKLYPEKMFFINYVDHEPITKDERMELTRTIKLRFPIEEKEVEVV